jgi:hypothetical protein
MARTLFRPARILSVLTGAALVAGILVPLATPTPAPAATKPASASDARPGELVDLRTRTSMTIRQADGTLQTVLSAGPVHYRDANGAWQRIDNNLVATSEAGYAYRNKANSFRTLFKAALDVDYLRVTSAWSIRTRSVEWICATTCSPTV